MNVEVLSAILDSLVDPVVFVDVDHIIRFINKAAQDKYGKRGHTDLVGKSIFDYHGEKSKQRIIGVLGGLINGVDEQFLTVSSDNQRVYMRIVRNQVGEPDWIL